MLRSAVSMHQEVCELCERTAFLTFHHLIPRKMHRRQYFRKKYTKEELGSGIRICQLCHRGLHKLFDEMTLAKEYSSLANILNNEDINKHVNWVKKQKRGLRLKVAPITDGSKDIQSLQ